MGKQFWLRFEFCCNPIMVENDLWDIVLLRFKFSFNFVLERAKPSSGGEKKHNNGIVFGKI